MGWRVLRAAYLVVKDAEKHEKTQTDKDPVRWVSLLYDFNTKWMKLEVRESKSLQLPPQMSLILKSNSINISFASSDPTFIVSVDSKRMGNVTLSYSQETFDTLLSTSDVLEWQTLFKSAISPCVTYAVTMVEEDIEQAAILCVTERSVQLSIAEHATNSKVMKRNGSSVISTDVDGIKLTVEDTLILTLNKQHVILRTNRLIELYQHLMSFFTGRRTAVGDFDLANFDYVNTRRGSRKDVLEEDESDGLYLPFENPYGYVRHSPSPRNTPDSSPSGSPRMSRINNVKSSPRPTRPCGSPRRLSSPRNTPSPSPSHRRRSQTPEFKFSSPMPSPKPSRPPPNLPSPDSPLPALKKLPKIGSHHLPKIGGQSSKPQPPPKPKNAKEILSEFESKSGNSFRYSDEPIYKSVRKPKATISASSIGIRGLSETSNDEDLTPALPPTPPEYASFNGLNKGHGHQNDRSGFNPDVEYINVNPRRTSENLPGSKPLLSPTSGPRRVSEDGVLLETSAMRFPNRQNAIRSPGIPSQLPVEVRDEKEADLDDLYESIYSLGIHSDPLETLPPPRDSWLNDNSPVADTQFAGFLQFGSDIHQAAPRKVLLSKIQRFDKRALRKTYC